MTIELSFDDFMISESENWNPILQMINASLYSKPWPLPFHNFVKVSGPYMITFFMARWNMANDVNKLILFFRLL
jgi:hypothetical protein